MREDPPKAQDGFEGIRSAASTIPNQGEDLLAKIEVPSDLDDVLNSAWEAAQKVPGHLFEDEARFLGTVVACAPSTGAIVEIGSFKGKSTVMIAKVAKHYGLGPIVAIDPHNSPKLLDTHADPAASSYQDFLNNLEAAGVSDRVEPLRAYSTEVFRTWNRPIRILWIDGDHSYAGTKTDFDGFLPYLNSDGVLVFHDVLAMFPGPIRVFSEDVLRSNQFGAAGFVRSIGWSQFRPEDGCKFQKQRASIERAAGRLSSLVAHLGNGSGLHGLAYARFRLNRFLISSPPIRPDNWVSLLDPPAQS